MGCGAVAMAMSVVFLATFSGPRVSAQDLAPVPVPVPAPAPDCFNNLLNMSDCLTYVEVGSNLTKPEKGCCPALAGVLESSPICLCRLLSDSTSYGIQLNTTKVIRLPSVCRVSTPPLTLCAAVGVPVSVPTASQDQTAPGSSGPETVHPTDGKNGGSGSRALTMVFHVGLTSAIVAIFF